MKLEPGMQKNVIMPLDNFATSLTTRVFINTKIHSFYVFICLSDSTEQIVPMNRDFTYISYNAFKRTVPRNLKMHNTIKIYNAIQ